MIRVPFMSGVISAVRRIIGWLRLMVAMPRILEYLRLMVAMPRMVMVMMVLMAVRSRLAPLVLNAQIVDQFRDVGRRQLEVRHADPVISFVELESDRIS